MFHLPRPAMPPQQTSRRGRSQRAQGMVEYGLILALIALVVLGVVTVAGRNTKSALCGASRGLGSTGTCTTISTAYVTTGQGTSGVTPIPMDTKNIAGGVIPTGVATNQIAVTPDGTRAYATTFTNSVIPIALGSGQAETPITIGAATSVVMGIAITPDGTRAYVNGQIDGIGAIVAITLNDGVVHSKIPLSTWSNYSGIAITPDGTRAYVTEGMLGGSVTPVTLSPTGPSYGAAGTAVNGGGTMAGAIAITPDGSKAYVANYSSNNVTPFDLSATSPFLTAGTRFGVGANPRGIAITPDGTKVFVTNYSDNSVIVFAVPSNSPLTGAIGVQAALGVAFSRDGATAYIASAAGTLNVTPIAVAGYAKGQAITVSGNPVGIAISP